ncbi:hypothetical protein GE115_02600 [Agromyces sp. CFH 90414]|uniref:Uncharacterized protein n=1 Tax=Agromyces agglutinans TaxID=2662258 RepID=A0A6I2F4V6_9MICO|nr:hypothetical protein [Agromyces agglutinans]MRG58767.1 hypothetical protein [Agromyces agglutinans]
MTKDGTVDMGSADDVEVEDGIHRRVRQLERITTLWTAAVAGTLTGFGLLVPFTTGRITGDPASVSIAEYAVLVLSGRSDPGDPFSFMIGLGILGLALVLIVGSWNSAALAVGDQGGDVLVRICAVLALVGCAVLWALLMLGVATDGWRIDVGLPLLTLAAVILTIFGFAGAYRRMRNPTRRTRTPDRGER